MIIINYECRQFQVFPPYSIYTTTNSYTERNIPASLSYERFLNLRENFMCPLHDFTCMLLFVTVQNVESTVQDVEATGNSVNLTAFYH